MKKSKINLAFTLVELIVVITILAILGTIAFISLQGYSSQARDSKRLSDINNIKKSLELFTINTGKYPIPDDTYEISYSGDLARSQGSIGDQVFINLSRYLNEKPTDPLTGLEYPYSTIFSQTEYELLSIYETDLISFISSTNAESQDYTRIDGNYNGIYIKTDNFVLPTPSIINGAIFQDVNLIDDETLIKSQVITGGDNIPGVSTGLLDIPLIVYEGSITENSPTEDKISVIETIQSVYTGTTLAMSDNIQPIMLATSDVEKESIANTVVFNVVEDLVSNDDSGDENTSSPFISIWNTVKTGTSGSNQITLPLESDGTYNFTVVRGDGSSDTITSYNQDEITHTYDTSGIYQVEISGDIVGFRFNNTGDKDKITEITQWGDLRVGNNGGYFYGCGFLNFTGTDTLNLTGTTNLDHMFAEAGHFNGDIDNWNTSNVTDMSSMFYYAYDFNQDLNNWDTSNVLKMTAMFQKAEAFDGNITTWNTSKVTDMANMFFGTDAFNQNIATSGSYWNTSEVTSMHYMFNNADGFNQDISNWDTSKVTYMAAMFNSTDLFNQDLRDWNVSLVTGCGGFDYLANSWVLQKPYFTTCSPFISVWNTAITGTSSSTQIQLPLKSDGTYNFTVERGDGSSSIITSYDQAEVTHTYDTSGIYQVEITGTIVGFGFNNSGDKNKITEITNWGNLRVGNNGGYFYGCNNLNFTGTDNLNLLGTTNLDHMFANAGNFNGDISDWDTSNVTDMANMFFGTDSFNQNIATSGSYWDTSEVRSMHYMFYNADGFNQDISNWNTSNVIYMAYIFASTDLFNQDLSGWDVDQVTGCGNFDYLSVSWVLDKPNFTNCTP